jgi:hypothetical protein
MTADHHLAVQGTDQGGSRHEPGAQPVKEKSHTVASKKVPPSLLAPQRTSLRSKCRGFLLTFPCFGREGRMDMADTGQDSAPGMDAPPACVGILEGNLKGKPFTHRPFPLFLRFPASSSPIEYDRITVAYIVIREIDLSVRLRHGSCVWLLNRLDQVSAYFSRMLRLVSIPGI